MNYWVTSAEAVALSGFNSDYLRRLIRTSCILAEKKGGHYWIDCQSLFIYINAANKAKDARRGSKAFKLTD